MALKKKNQTNRSANEQIQRKKERGFDELVAGLESSDVSVRRWCARDLATMENSTGVLLSALENEAEHVVFEAILDALESIGSDEVVLGLISMLRSEDAARRNGVIEALQSMPDMVALHIIELLNDTDSDVRIFAIDILQVLAHPDTPKWLLSVLKDETHINVVSTAVDRLAEVGTPDMINDIKALKERYPNEAYLHFAIDTAVTRIVGE